MICFIILGDANIRFNAPFLIVGLKLAGELDFIGSLLMTAPLVDFLAWTEGSTTPVLEMLRPALSIRELICTGVPA